MKAKQGKLDASKKYYYGHLVIKTESEACENCGKSVQNVAIVKNEDGKVYRLCFGCMLELRGKDKSFALVDKFVKFLKKDCKYMLIEKGECYMYKNHEDVMNNDYMYRYPKSLIDEISRSVNITGIWIKR